MSDDPLDCLELVEENNFNNKSGPTFEGQLSKWTNYIHGWQSRHFVLKDSTLTYYKSENEAKFGCRGAIAIQKANVKLHEFDNCRFDVSVGDCVWYLRAENVELRDKWVEILEAHRLKHKSDAITVDIVASLYSHYIELMQEKELWKRKYEEEVDKRKRLEEQIKLLTKNTSGNQLKLTNGSLKFEKKEIELDQSQGDNSSINELSTESGIAKELSKKESKESKELTVNNSNNSNNSTSLLNNVNISGKHRLWSEIESITMDQLYHAQLEIGEGGSKGWELFAEDGEMRLYKRELEIDGLVCDPLKAVHTVKGVTGHEMCHYFFSPDVRFDWENTLDSMNVIEEINQDTLIFHQIHKRIWPAAQRDTVFWSHIRRIEPNTEKDPTSLHDTWIVCNHSTDRPDVPLGHCVRMILTVSLVCETYINPQDEITRDNLTCKIIYSSTINPGGWAPASILRALYKREYPKFLNRFTQFVKDATKNKPIMF